MNDKPSSASGVLEILKGRGGFLRDPERSFRRDSTDTFVPQKLIARFGLITGAVVSGPTRPAKRGVQLADVESVCGMTPEAFRERTPFNKLQAVNPDRRFRLCDSGNPSMRIVDMLAPVGRGTRGLIVAAPKTGKTQLLEDLTKAIHSDATETRVVVLLIDERPEEVTHFRRRHLQKTSLKLAPNKGLHYR
ncbi:MAG: hypothetical protein P8181_10830, partial [bacterium]